MCVYWNDISRMCHSNIRTPTPPPQWPWLWSLGPVNIHTGPSLEIINKAKVTKCTKACHVWKEISKTVTEIRAWINNHNSVKLLRYNYSYLPKRQWWFSLTTFEIWPWIRNYIPQTIDVITYPCRKLNDISKRGLHWHNCMHDTVICRWLQFTNTTEETWDPFRFPIRLMLFIRGYGYKELLIALGWFVRRELRNWLIA